MREQLPIIYHTLPSGKIHVSLIAVPIATITFSDTTKNYFVNFTHISDEVVELHFKKDCVEEISKKVNEWLDDVLNIESPKEDKPTDLI